MRQPTSRAPQEIPEPRPVPMKPTNDQPSKAEMQEEFDMPGLSESEAFEAFFQPIWPVGDWTSMTYTSREDPMTTLALTLAVVFGSLLASSPSRAADCSMVEAKAEAVSDFIEEHYGDASIMIYRTDEADLMEAYFHHYEPQERDCGGKVRVDDDCRITDAEGASLDRAASRQRTFQCKLSSG